MAEKPAVGEDQRGAGFLGHERASQTDFYSINGVGGDKRAAIHASV
jgi:hypothetical protein